MMGILHIPRNSYTPPADNPSPTLLGARASDLVLAADPESSATDNDPRFSRPKAQPDSARQGPRAIPANLDYGTRPQAEIESGMSDTERRINRSRALLSHARRSLPATISEPLPDDWERTKPSDVVADIRGATQRYNIPRLPFARSMYQEGKFNEVEKLPGGKPLVMQSSDPNQPVGWAQMTPATLEHLKALAKARGDMARFRELQGYSLANRAQAFDAAAEYLAYAYRLTGDWPSAFASYNYSPYYFQKWLTGDPKAQDPATLMVSGPKGAISKWREITDYVANAFRGQPELGQTSAGYERENARKGFRAARPVVPNPRVGDPWDRPDDPLENP
jgi:hypothetical protein